MDLPTKKSVGNYQQMFSTPFSVSNYQRNNISISKILPARVLLTNFLPSLIRW